ncbi:Hypothetical protein UVM_LOCUS250 [uncultured virus]|nr:Hypothetical protein UVM_LOCUS250 [uncultured virus]
MTATESDVSPPTDAGRWADECEAEDRADANAWQRQARHPRRTTEQPRTATHEPNASWPVPLHSVLLVIGRPGVHKTAFVRQQLVPELKRALGRDGRLALLSVDGERALLTTMALGPAVEGERALPTTKDPGPVDATNDGEDATDEPFFMPPRKRSVGSVRWSETEAAYRGHFATASHQVRSFIASLADDFAIHRSFWTASRC